MTETVTRKYIQKVQKEFMNGEYGDSDKLCIAGGKVSLSQTILDDFTEIGVAVVVEPTGVACEAVSNDTEDSAYGTGVLTLSANVSDTETVTIGDHVYTFQTSLTDLPDNVLIGALATDSIDNLIAAINNGAGEGTKYGTGTVINAYVTASAGAGDTMDVVDKVGLLTSATTETSGTASWAATSLVQHTGVKRIDVHYLNSSFKLVEESVLMDGTTKVALASTTNMDFIEWIHATVVGTNGVAEGNIVINDVTTSTVVYEKIIAGENQSLSCRFKIPGDKIGLIDEWQVSGITKIIDVRLRATCEKLDRNLIPGIFLFQDQVRLNDTTLPSSYNPPLFFPPLCVIKVSGISAAATGDGASSFKLLLRGL